MHGRTVFLGRVTASIALLLPGPPNAAAQPSWEARVGYEHQFVDSGAPLWNHWDLWTVQARRHFGQGSVAVGLVEAHRFNRTNHGMVVAGQLDLRPMTRLAAHVQIVPHEEVLPEQDLELVLAHDRASGWAGALRYRFVGFAGPDVHIFSADVARDLGPWSLRARADYTPSLDTSALFVSAVARRALSPPGSYLEILAGRGRRMLESGPGPTVAISGSHKVGIGLRMPIPRGLALSVHLTSTTPDAFPSRIAFRSALSARW